MLILVNIGQYQLTQFSTLVKFNQYLTDINQKGVYNQGCIEKDFFCLKPSKSEVVTFVKNFRKLLFQNSGVYKQL